MQEEHETARGGKKPTPGVISARSQLLALDEEQLALLRSIIGSYAQSMGLAAGGSIGLVAQEILQEAIVEALAHADSFDPERQIKAWLLGIALNVIRRKKVELARRQRREFSFSQISAGLEDGDDWLDTLLPATQAGLEEAVESAEGIDALLSLVSSDDQRILRLAFVEDFARDALAQRLGLSTGAARVRLHRALARLRAAWIAQQATTQKGAAHE